MRALPLFSLLAATIAVALPSPARAAEPSRPTYDLANTGAGFLALETTGVLVTFVAYSAGAGDPPARCSWCATNGFDDGVRDALRMSDPRPAAITSHVLSLGVIPLGSFAAVAVPSFLEGRGARAWKDAWIMADAFLLATAVADGTKKLVGRQRPGFHYGVQASTEAKSSPLEENLSFFSGDTAWAFTMASSATTLAYLHGYEGAPWIALAGGACAFGVGTLRVAADMHWASDVLVGALVGTTIGVGLPLLLHGRKAESRVSLVPMLGTTRGVMLAAAF